MVGWCNEIIWHELKTYLTHSFNVSFFLARIKKKLNLISRFRTKCWRIYCSSPLLPRAPSNFYPSLGSTIQMHIFFRKYRQRTDACCIQKSVLCALFFFLQNLLCSPLTSITTSRPFSKVHPLFLRFFFAFSTFVLTGEILLFFFLLCARNRALLLHVKGDSFWRISRDYVPSSSFRPFILHESGVATFLDLNALENKFLYAIFLCIRSIRDAPGDDCSQSDWGCPIT